MFEQKAKASKSPGHASCHSPSPVFHIRPLPNSEVPAKQDSSCLSGSSGNPQWWQPSSPSIHERPGLPHRRQTLNTKLSSSGSSDTELLWNKPASLALSSSRLGSPGRQNLYVFAMGILGVQGLVCRLLFKSKTSHSRPSALCVGECPIKETGEDEEREEGGKKGWRIEGTCSPFPREELFPAGAGSCLSVYDHGNEARLILAELQTFSFPLCSRAPPR